MAQFGGYPYVALALTLIAIALVKPRPPRAAGFIAHARADELS